MINLTLKEIVKDNICYLSKYRKGFLYYETEVGDTRYIFPIPVDDTGDATFDYSIKSITLMRYIRKALKEGSFIKTLNVV